MGFSRPRERIALRNVDEHTVQALAEAMSVSPLLARIFVARKLTTFDQCKSFFRPEADHLLDPFLFTDMEKAVDRLLAACDNRETIAVYGDYDVDGVTSTAIMVRALRSLGGNVIYYLPNRLLDGYGLTTVGIDECSAQGATVMVTVDCGVSAVDEAAYAAQQGIDLIITDHHEPAAVLPKVFALINHKVPSCGYPHQTLAGVGVAFKVVQALGIKRGMEPSFWEEYLDLAAVGTAADIVPLTGENRIICKFGFDRLGTTMNPGLRALLRHRKLYGSQMTTSQVVFLIAPCLNAVGRLGDPRRGAELLLTEDEAVADLYARELIEANTERKTIDKRVQHEAKAWVIDNCDESSDWAIVAGHPDWHCGVIGIVASKLIEQFYRPTILLSMNDTGFARGSGRSVRGLHLLNAIAACSDLLESYGGHAAAAGLTVRHENIEPFRQKFNEVVHTMLSVDDLSPLIDVDAQATVAELTPRLCNTLKQMEPFGPENMRPVLFTKNLRNRYAPKTVGDGHLKLSVTDGSAVFDAIGWGMGDRLGEIQSAQSFNLAYSLDENEYNGRTTLQMKIKGISL